MAALELAIGHPGLGLVMGVDSGVLLGMARRIDALEAAVASIEGATITPLRGELRPVDGPMVLDDAAEEGTKPQPRKRGTSTRQTRKTTDDQGAD